MQYLVTAQEMKAYDEYTIRQLGIPAEVLMERAALQVVDVMEQKCRDTGKTLTSLRILVAAGTGNNGGDGLAVARILADLGCRVDVVLVGNRERLSRENAMQLHILEKYGMSPVSNLPDGEYDMVVDALFGVGLGRDITGAYLKLIQEINQMPCLKIAVDIPSGIHADTGQICGAAVRADVTVTFAFVKRGLKFYPGADYAGQVICAEIGITPRSFWEKYPEMYTLTEDIKELLPERAKDGNKGTFGKVLLLAGSDQMAGAAILASRSAYRAGAGMVKVVSCETNRVILQESVPEALLLTYRESGVNLQGSVEWADTIVAGPGLGTSEISKTVLTGLLREWRPEQTLVLDADALNLLAVNPELQVLLTEKSGAGWRSKTAEENGKSSASGNVILTPHMGELARLLGKTISEVKAKPVQAVREAARKYHCTVVGKDARTLVCTENGQIYMNTAGNSGMATAGSGDVLTGIIGALCAGGLQAEQAAVLGTYLHALSGDAAAGQKGEAGLMASDLIEGMTAVQKG